MKYTLMETRNVRGKSWSSLKGHLHHPQDKCMVYYPEREITNDISDI